MFSEWLVSGGLGGCSQIFSQKVLRALQAQCLVNKKTFHSIYFSVTCCLLLANFLVEKHSSPSVCICFIKVEGLKEMMKHDKTPGHKMLVGV